MRYAILDGQNNVVNICEWDGNEQTWQPPSGHHAVLDDTVPYTYLMPEPPEPPGLYVASFGFEVSAEQGSIDRLRDDYVHQTSKIARGAKGKNDTTLIKVADKFGTKHDIQFKDYITGLDYIGDVIRAQWESGA
jgi:hypothetical protein